MKLDRRTDTVSSKGSAADDWPSTTLAETTGEGDVVLRLAVWLSEVSAEAAVHPRTRATPGSRSGRKAGAFAPVDGWPAS